MSSLARGSRSFALVLAGSLSLAAAVAFAQQGPIAAMFSDDQQRDASLAASFTVVDLPAPSAAGSPLKVYLSAGDMERAFDRAPFRPDAAIVPTNTELQITAASPATQRVLIDRVQKQPEVLRGLQSQIEARRKQPSPATGAESGLLRIGIDSFVAQLSARGTPSPGAFPKSACLIATDFPNGGAVDRRELFAQDRVRQGVAACLDALDGSGVQSLVLPLMGASSSKVQANDAMLEGQRTLRECRLINSTAGIALGIHDFAGRRHNLRDIGVIQWDQEIASMFKVPADSRAARSAQLAYRSYADQVQNALRKGLAGQKTSSSDVNGSCRTILDVK